MNRRDFLKALSAGCVLPLLPASASASRRRLNVVSLMMDQHHHAIMGCAGNPVVKTPNLDRLASQGVRFENAVAATPYCSPTRAALITGRWPHSTGIVQNCAPKNPALTSQEGSLEGRLFEAGYATEHIGKWHLGVKSDFRCYAKSMSIKERIEAHKRMLEAKGVGPGKPRDGETLIEKAGVFVRPANYRAWQAFHATPAGKARGQDLMAIGREAVPANMEFWGTCADDAVEWIKANRNRRFMLTYSAGPPHALWTAPDPWYSMYEPQEMPVPKTLTDPMPAAYEKSGPALKGKHLGEEGFREMIRCYYAQVSMIDSYIGRILDTLDEQGLAENTLVIYLSDHGDMQGAQGGMLGKSLGAFYDQIVRVPLMMRLPGVIEAGGVVKAHANSVDVPVTVMDYLSMPIPKAVQGRSLRPLIEGSRADEVGYGFCERPGGRMVRSAEMKYCFYFRGSGTREELFDLARDPDETTNLAGNARYAEQKKRLQEVLAQHMRRTEDDDLGKLKAVIA